MLRTIAAMLVTLWLLGLPTGYSMGLFIHVLGEDGWQNYASTR
jgi:hypothetical protein